MSTIGHTVDEQLENLARMKGLSVEDLIGFLGGKEFANKAQLGILEKLGGVGSGKGFGASAARFAGSKAANTALRFVPGLTTATAALGAADIVAGNDSFGNKPVIPQQWVSVALPVVYLVAQLVQQLEQH